MSVLTEFVRDMDSVRDRGDFDLRWNPAHVGLLFHRTRQFRSPAVLDESHHPFYVHPDPVHPIEMWLAVRGFLGTGVRIAAYERGKVLETGRTLCEFAAARLTHIPRPSLLLLDLLLTPRGLNGDKRVPAVLHACDRLGAALGLCGEFSRISKNVLRFGGGAGCFTRLEDIIGYTPIEGLL